MSTLKKLFAMMAVATLYVATPDNLQAQSGGGYNVTLAWDDELNDPTDLVEYRIYKKDDNVSEGKVLLGQVPSSEPKVAQLNLEAGVHVLYVVAVDKNFGLESDPSNLVETTAKPAAPTNLRITVTVVVETPTP